MLKNECSQTLNIQLAGENALIIYFSGGDSSNISAKVQQAEKLIRQAMKVDLTIGIIDLVSSYASIMVMFDLHTTAHYQVRKKVRVLLEGVDKQNLMTSSPASSSIVELPVYYGEESGPDLAAIAQRSKLTIEQVIDIHQAQEYRVYAIGFAPGFAYLGEVDERIATPRLSTPRLSVPKGAVAIADKQTAVYPNTSPGGWNIIGLCPIDMFNVNATPIMPVSVGDLVKFKAISKDEYRVLGGVLPKNLGAIT